MDSRLGARTAMPASSTLASRVAGCSTMRLGVMRMLLPVASTGCCFWGSSVGACIPDTYHHVLVVCAEVMIGVVRLTAEAALGAPLLGLARQTRITMP